MLSVPQANQIEFQHGVGCRQCNDTGMRGLTGVYEFFAVTPELAEMILANSSLNRIREEARRNGYTPLFEAGLKKVKSGQICVEELLKETSSAEDFLIEETPEQIEQINVGTL